ncbi:MAG TPA: PKD domain-containing protein [Kofleriaceae bacterium]|nr:PKD domain-containing protein [Kofleriaceae bacterium]
MEARLPRRSLVSDWVAVVLAITTGACTFDPSAPVGGASGGGAADDGDEDDGGDDSTPADCPEALHTVLSVNGVEASGGDQPIATVLLGDTVTLSAAGSCSQRGPVTYQWAIEDGDLRHSVDTGLDSQSLRVYPSLPGDYLVTLTVSDDVASGEPVTVHALRADAWGQVSDQADVRDVAMGAGRMWIAAGAGAFYIDLDDTASGAKLLNDAVPGPPDVSNNLSAVHFGSGDLVWFARQGNANQVWRVGDASLAVEVIDLPGNNDVRDIASSGPGVMVGGKDGVLSSLDNNTFGAPNPEVDVFAVADNADGSWAGGSALFRVGGSMFSPFPDADNKIRALVGDGDLVWAGSDGQGVARFDGADATVFTEADGLPSNVIRALAVESSGDVWAATAVGVARYKQDRKVWVKMADQAGLTGLLDATGIAVLEAGGERQIAVGAGGGIAILGP